MDWTLIINQAPTLAFGIIVIGYTLEMLKRQEANTDKHHDRWQEYLEAEAARWREFLTEQRDQRNIGMARLAEEIKANTHELTKLAAIIAQHDQRVSQSLEEVKGR